MKATIKIRLTDNGNALKLIVSPGEDALLRDLFEKFQGGTAYLATGVRSYSKRNTEIVIKIVPPLK